ncbi:MAG: hypothetical protein R6U52_11260 [Kosmotogaceae bacterium]
MLSPLPHYPQSMLLRETYPVDLAGIYASQPKRRPSVVPRYSGAAKGVKAVMHNQDFDRIASRLITFKPGNLLKLLVELFNDIFHNVVIRPQIGILETFYQVGESDP